MSTRFKLSALAGITSIAALQVALVAPAAAQTSDITAIQQQIQALQKQNEALQKQIQDLQAQVNNAQASADSLQKTGGPVNKEHPGYWQLPGTQTWMTVAGHVKLDAIYDFKQSVGPQDDFGAIPMNGAPGTDRKGTWANSNAKQSYIYFETHTNTPYGDLMSHISGDFYLSAQGNPNISNSYAFRLRNAYGALGEWTFGQDWTTFQDTAAGPNSLDFNGPAGQVFIRQPQVRWTHSIKGTPDTVMVSLENNTGDYFSPAGLYNGNQWNVDQDGQLGDPAGCTLGRVSPCQNGPSQLAGSVPDIVGRWQRDSDFGHLSFMGVAREINVDTGTIGVPPDQVVKTHKWGFGLGMNAVLNMNQLSQSLGADQMFFSLNGGPGIGRYLQDLLFNGAILNDNTHQLDIVTSLGTFVGYEHFFASDEWESNLIYGYEHSSLKDVDQLIANGDQLTKQSQSVHVNLIWHPVPSTSFGVEYSWGERKVEGFIPDGQQDHGTMSRLQFSGIYNF